ncbi:hypothetical protein DFH29DRAFT_250306 [Suillus ampliporus]|nr:hypothetical protein DFH29DRAFT_250306 [Suillus ampliporus]
MDVNLEAGIHQLDHATIYICDCDVCLRKNRGQPKQVKRTTYYGHRNSRLSRHRPQPLPPTILPQPHHVTLVVPVASSSKRPVEMEPSVFRKKARVQETVGSAHSQDGSKPDHFDSDTPSIIDQDPISQPRLSDPADIINPGYDEFEDINDMAHSLSQSFSFIRGAQYASHLHVATDDQHPIMSENFTGCVNQAPSGEPASQVQAAPSALQEGTGHQSVDADLRVAHETSERINLLRRHASSVASPSQNAEADLDIAYNFQTTYLQPLRIFDTAIKKIANVHPYAKMALGVLSAASKIILAQADHDQPVHCLLKKLDEVYRFITQDDTLSQISSMHSIVGRIAQQTQECARFVRDYSETKSYCE